MAPRRPRPRTTSHWTTLLTTPTPLLNLTNRSKRRILQATASDMTTAFRRIRHLLETKILSPQHTQPIENVIAQILRTEERHSRDLERQVRRVERRSLRRRIRWMKERRWMRKSFVGVLGKAMKVFYPGRKISAEMSNPGDYSAVRRDIVAQLKKPDYDDGSAGPVFVRLAWHSAGTYDAESDTGGSNGAGMRYEAEGGDPANAGLQHGRAFLEPVKEKNPWITYSDLWTLAGVVAVEEMGGPKVPWKPGRTDLVDDSKVPPRGRLPDGAQGADHLRFIFYRMGFNDQEIVALAGGHNLGRCHMDRSGFEGPWVNNPTRFSNQFFKLLLKLEWKPRTLSNGVQQFNYVDPDADEDDEPLMMLPTDISLITDPSFRQWVERYAEDKDLFFDHFAKVFGKLVELGIRRDEQGAIVNTDNVKGGYVSAPKKSNTATGPAKKQDGCVRARL
ncbi:peroxidase [Aspergillus affinis]|uniref:peroxidase n=1 Tax=Aspergillus affinis TaxID=1070780 RepID=UPI0022FE9982|nr:uncharacterized protein KD926_008121 [Aspergillus affinis]KAI9040554.1 hypothetical protein KD926_008121 [Aspergillus affinis]